MHFTVQGKNEFLNSNFGLVMQYKTPMQIIF